MSSEFDGLIVISRDEPFPQATAEAIAARLYGGAEVNQMSADDLYLYFEVADE